MSDWIVGSAARIQLAVADAAGLPVDPGVLRLLVMPPAGNVVTYTYGAGPDLVRTAPGAYHLDVALNKSGRWCWRWETDAPQASVSEGQLLVARSRFVQEAP